MTRYWIGVVHRMHATTAQERGFCGFSHGKESAVRKLSPGDKFVFYAPRETMQGAPVQAFVGLGTVDEGEPMAIQLPGTDFTPFTRRATYEDIVEVPVRPMLEDLGFVKSVRNWGMAFRRSLFEIDKRDFDLIANAMRPK